MSTGADGLTCRYFVTYSGVKLPLKLVDELNEADLRNRNTFVRGYYDPHDRLVLCEKVVYNSVELSHRYSYGDNGVLLRATIALGDDEETTLEFDEAGRPSPCAIS